MKIIVIILLVGSPIFAAEPQPKTPETAVPMEMPATSFEEDVDDAWDKIRRLLLESKRDKYGKEINRALARHDATAAQSALDGLIKDFPEVLKQQPFAIKYHQGNIAFWKRDFRTAYSELNLLVTTLERKYPNGIPAGKYAETNTSFMSDAYFGRGATQMQLGRYLEAVSDMDKAQSLVLPKYSTIKAYIPLNKCRALIKLKNYNAAAEAFGLAYKLNPLVAEKAEDKDYICGSLAKNGLRPKPCPGSGVSPLK